MRTLPTRVSWPADIRESAFSDAAKLNMHRCFYLLDYAVIYLDRTFETNFILGLNRAFYGTVDLQTAGEFCPHN